MFLICKQFYEIYMIGWIFLAFGIGTIGYLLFTSAGAALLSGLVGFTVEPLTTTMGLTTTVWTDWLTWSLTDFYGLLLLGSMGLLLVVMAMNVASGDAIK